MIYIVDGKIGSGKSYFVVYHILKTFYEYDKKCDEWFIQKDHILFTNIEGLKCCHVDLEELIESKGVEVIFSKKYMEELRKEYSRKTIVFAIDESQFKFDRKYYDKNVFALFQYSRHFGLDVYLITQDADSLAREIKTLAEYTMRAVRRSLTSGLNFTYRKIINDETVRTVHLPMRKDVFRMYKSFRFDEGEKPVPVWRRYAVILVVLLAIVGLVFKFLFLDFWFSSGKKNFNKQNIAQFQRKGGSGVRSFGDAQVVGFKDLKKKDERLIKNVRSDPREENIKVNQNERIKIMSEIDKLDNKDQVKESSCVIQVVENSGNYQRSIEGCSDHYIVKDFVDNEKVFEKTVPVKTRIASSVTGGSLALPHATTPKKAK